MPAPEPTWLDYLSAVGAIATPLLVLALTALGFKLRHQLERRSELEDKLRDDRINAYNEILEPFVILLMSDAAWESDPKSKNKDKGAAGMQAMFSLWYRRQAFKMSLVASDGVVKAYNDLMQYVYGMSAQEGQQGKAAVAIPDAQIEAKLAGTRANSSRCSGSSC